MPATNHDDDEIEKLYEEISEIVHQEGRGQVNAIVMGDFNRIMGEGSTDKGPFINYVRIILAIFDSLYPHVRVRNIFQIPPPILT